MDANNSINTTITPDAIDSSAAASIATAASAYAQFALQAAALVPGQDGQLVLPEGVSLSDIRVSGRNLIVRMPDGSEVVIEDGAIVIPQFVIDGVAIPSVNLAALLVGQEPAPAAGPTSSSGGNFEQDPGDIGDPFGLGDLLPPTELAFLEPDPVEQLPELIDRDPDVNIQDGGPAGKDVTDNVSEVGLPGTRANGNVETPGSSTGNGSDSTTGFIIVSSPDGIASITINGTTYTGVAGQQIVTANGVLTLGVLSGDQIPYTYRLTDNTAGDGTTDVFTVVLTDPDGDTSTARLTINIADDVPTARADTDSVAGGTYGPESGNVLTGTGTTSGATGADTLGADGAAVSGFRAGASGSFAAVGTTIAGQYGTLTLGANGSYTYVRNPNTPGGVSDVFTYQITDGDGDASTATLTINIGDAPNRITFVPEIGEGTEVRESHLPARDGEPSGSQFDGNGETAAGTITFTSPDGVASVAIAGVTITPGSLPQTVVSNATGTLVITGYSFNPATGVGSINYTYTLNDNTLNTSGTTVGFPISVTDLDGDTANDQLDIRIIDDAPTAANDSGTQATENAVVTVNVLANDTSGADGVNPATGVSLVAGSLSGAGTLAYAGNGNFTYTPAAGEEGVVTFQYTITDGDGDPSTATVTITLLKDSEPQVDVSGGTTVSEAGLPVRGSEPAGSDAASNSETTSGTIAVSTGGDTLQSLVINGVNVTAGGTVTGAHGTLTVTLSAGAYSYSYTLTDNTSGNTTSDSFTVVVTDSDGDSASDTLVVAITDDVPSAADDADSIAAGQYGPATGNVITDAEGDGGADVKGADNATVTAVSGAAVGTVGGSTAGQYGVLTLNADGSYSYVRNAGTPGGVTDVFSYTITDGDGDPSTATLTISIADSPTTLDLPTEGEAGTQVNENGLPAGSAAATNNELTSGTIAYTAPDGPASVTIDGVAITAVGQTFTGSFGTLTITSIANGVIGYDYLLTTNTSGNATFDDFAVVVTDKDGDSTPGTLTINIVDDVPTARADVDSVTEDGPIVADGNVITGANVADANATDGVADTKGADGATVTAVAFGATSGTVGSALAGNYGSLTLNADGSYSYTLNNSDPVIQGLDKDDSLTEVFTYTITDGDGDPSTTTLTITINGNDDPITINGLSVEGPDLIVDEDDLADGSSPDAPALLKTGSFTVNGLDGIASVKIEGTETFVGQQFTTAYGKFTITSISAPADGNTTAITIGYSYELTDNAAHSNAGGQNFLTELFDVEVTDTDGSTDTDQVEVRIIDDVPTAADDTDTMSGGNYGPVTGNVITDASAGDAADGDNGADTPGADGVTVISVSSVNVPANSDSTVDGLGNYEVNGQYGVLTVAPDGSYSYIRNPGTPGDVTDTFNYVIRDADGDLANANLAISVRDSGTTLDVPTTGEAGTSVSEVGLPARGAEPEGSGEEAAAGANGDTSEATSGTITFTAPDGPAVVTIEGKDGPVTISAAGQTVNGLSGVLTVNSYNAVSGAITYTYVLVDNTSGDATSETFVVKVQDADDDSTTLDLVIDITDDMPMARADTDGAVEGGTASGNVLTGTGTTSGAAGADTPGADGFAAGGGVVGVKAGNDTSTPVTTGAGTAITGLYGTLTLNADGSYSYDGNPNVISAAATDVFVYTVRDGDGDLSTTTLTINLTPVTLAADNDTITVNEAALDTTIDAGDIAAGTITGSNPASTAESVTATLNVAGAVSYTLSSSAAGNYGVLSLQSNGTYTYTLVQPFDTTPDANNGVTTETGKDVFTYTATDANGNTTTGTITVDIIDDVPTLSVSGDVTVVEGATATGTWSETIGADQPGASTVVVVGGTSHALGSAINTGNGTLTVAANGTWSFVANNNLDNDLNPSVTFTVRVTDADGDVAEDTQTVAITDGAGPSAGDPLTLALDDQNLADGTTSANPDSASGTVSFTAGSDALTSFAFAASIAGLGAGLTWTRVSDTLIQGRDGANLIVSLTLTAPASIAAGGNGTVTVTATLHDNYDSHPTFTSDDLVNLGSVGVVASDQDGDSATATVNVTVSDDVPTLSVSGDVTVVEGATATGTWSETIGADQPGASTVVVVGGTSHALGSAIDTGNGTLTVAANGTWSFVANNNLDNDLNPSVTFTVRVTDADGDVAEDTQTVAITDGAGPSAGDPLTLALDDQNLADGTTSANPDSASGTVSFTAGSDALTSFAFAASIAGLGAGLTWTRVSDTLIQGRDGANLIVSLTLTPPASIAAGGNGTATVTATLHDNYDSHPTFTSDDLVELGSVGVVASDQDGDSATATVNVTVSDDVPTAVADTARTVAEDAVGTIGGNVLTNDTQGADGAVVTHVNLGTGFVAITSGSLVAGAYQFTTAKGVYTFKADGSWTFDPANNQNNASGIDASFSYRITDGDGDISEALQPITVTDGAGPSNAAPITLDVNEAALNTAGAVGTNPSLTTETDNAPALSFTAGSDALTSFQFSTNLSSLVSNLDGAGTDIVWVRAADGQSIAGHLGNAGGPVAITLTLSAPASIAAGATGSVTVTATLADNLPHATALAAQISSLGSVLVEASDLDGDVATGQVSVNVQDDVPVITSTPTPLAVLNNGTVSATGNFVFSTGADGPATGNDAIKDDIGFTATVNGANVTNPTISQVSETATTAIFNFSFSYSTGATSTATATGVLTFNKAAGTYTVDLDGPILGYSINDTASGTLFQGYELGTSTPDSTQPAVSVTKISDNLFIQFTGVNGTSSTGNYGLVNPLTNDGAPGNWTAGELFNASPSWVSVSNSANGVAGDTIGGDEILDFNLYSTNPFGNVGTTQAPAESMFLKFDGMGNQEDFIVVLKLYDPTTNSYTTKALMVQNGDIQKGPGTGPGIFSNITLDNNDGLIVIESNDYNSGTENWKIIGAQIIVDPLAITGTAINFNNVTGAAGASTGTQTFAADVNTGSPMKISSIGFLTVSTTAQSAQLTFNVTVQDSDGDTASQTLVVNVSGTSPIVLDLDGDGAEFLSTAAGVAFDYLGDGNPESTAWVGADDGLLAIDSNGNGLVDNGSEIVFGGNGLTDLQGVAAKYDSNKDGVLDANDADFAKFGVWQDANSNGVTDAGEFRSLTDAGIVSINLVSNGVEYAAANGEVTVHGTASYTKADGTTGDVADASFATAGETKVAANENDQRVLASANTGMASSLVAAGLVAAIAGATENASSLHEQIGGSEFVTRTVSENPADFAEIEAPDHAGLLNDTSGAAGIDASDLIGSAKFSSYEQVEDHADGNFGDFGGMDSGSLISDLLASTEIEHSNFAQSSFTIGSHVDAASEALIAIQQGDMFAKAAIEEVVADALAGGAGEGANVDALLNALAGPANDTQLLGDTLSQQFGDHPAFEGFNLAAANDLLDQLASTHMEMSAATGHHG